MRLRRLIRVIREISTEKNFRVFRTQKLPCTSVSIRVR